MKRRKTVLSLVIGCGRESGGEAEQLGLQSLFVAIAAQAVAADGKPRAFVRGYTEARRAAGQKKTRMKLPPALRPFFSTASKLRRPFRRSDLGKSVVPAHLIGDREALAALGAASRQHFAAEVRSDALAEAVLVTTFAVGWLIGAFHRWLSVVSGR